MAKLQLSFACGLYDRMQPLYTGEVKAEGIDLNFIAIDQPRPIFDRMSGGHEFDVAEYLELRIRPALRQQAVPVRGHSGVSLARVPPWLHRHPPQGRHQDAQGPRGQAVGVPLLHHDGGDLHHGLLQHEYGVDLRKIQWVQGAMNTRGAHGSPTVLPLLKPMPIEQNTSNKSMSDLIEERVVDATLGTSLPEAIRTNPDIARLFPNYVELEKEYYKRTESIRSCTWSRSARMSTSDIRSSPEPLSCVLRSKEIALEKMFNLRALRYMTPFLMRDIDEIYEIFDGDPWPYGLEPNRPTWKPS